MIVLSMSRIGPDKVDLLRSWMAELSRRADEVRETFRQEGITHEIAYLLRCGGDHVLVYMMETDDPDHATRAFQRSTLPIDLQHRQVMREVDGQGLAADKLLDVRLD